MPMPPRCRIIAECASNHGGSVDCIDRMIEAAQAADFVKFQAYQTARLSGDDPQYTWLEQAELSLTTIRHIVDKLGPRALFSVFDAEMVYRLRQFGIKAFKVGHADRWRKLWAAASADEEWFISCAWGQDLPEDRAYITPLVVIPIYPAQLGALAALPAFPDGYSDHTIGLDACKIMMARGVMVIEKHFSIEGCRRQPWDMDEAGLAELGAWSKVCATAQNGTDQAERWGR